MAEFFCIYSGQSFDEGERSDEHIVPYSIGGSNRFVTRDVSRLANNGAGSRADASLVNNFFIASERWSRKIESEDGHVPTIEFRGTVDVKGAAVRASLQVRPDGSTTLALVPKVSSNWSAQTFNVACDPTDLPRIAADIEKKGRSKGLSFKLLDHAKEMQTEAVPAPKMVTNFSFETTSFGRAFVKMALGTGHWVLGEQWSRSCHASELRVVLNTSGEVDWAKVAIHGRVWPDSPGSLESIAVGDHRHVLFVSNLSPLGFYALLFGKYDGMVQLAPGEWSGKGPANGDGHIIVVDSRTREVWEFGFIEFVSKKERGTLPFST